MSPLRPIARRALAAQSDERLVRLLREGHDPAFEEIVRRYRPSLVAFATAIVSHSRAEDVVQNSLEKAHRALLGDSRDVALKPWLFTIVRNGALNTIRAEPLAEELISATSTVPGPAELAEQNDELERLVDAIVALPAAQRQALVKRELEGEGHGEIAAQLGTSATAVRGLIFRARTSLRDAVGAILPLPVLRMLLTEGSAVAGGTAAVGGGAGAAVLGGAGAKGGTVIAAAIVALGTGIAVERNRGSGERGGNDGRAVAARSADTSRGSSGSNALPADSGTAGLTESAGNGTDPAPGGGSDRTQFEDLGGHGGSESAAGETSGSSGSGSGGSGNEDGAPGSHDGSGSPGGGEQPRGDGDAGGGHGGPGDGGPGGTYPGGAYPEGPSSGGGYPDSGGGYPDTDGGGGESSGGRSSGSGPAPAPPYVPGGSGGSGSGLDDGSGHGGSGEG